MCYCIICQCNCLFERLLCYFAALECSACYICPRMHERSAYLVFGQLQHHGRCAAWHIVTPGKKGPVRYPLKGVSGLLLRYGKSHLTIFNYNFLFKFNITDKLRWHSGNLVALL